MIKCPLCDLTTGHSHFSYDIAKYVDDLQAKLEQRIAMEIDEHTKVVSLQAKLDVATKGIIDAMTYITCPPGVWNILNTALAEINRIGGMNVQG
jgi:hypothetical protein